MIRVIIIMVILLIILVTSVFIFFSANPSEILLDCNLLSSESDLAVCEQYNTYCKDSDLNNIELGNYCNNYKSNFFNKIAKESNDIKYCEEIEISKTKDSCFLHFAKFTGNPMYCDKLSSTEIKDKCFFEIPAILKSISITDIPTIYKPIIVPESYQLYSKTELIQVKTQVAPGSFSTVDEYRFASINPLECEKVRNSKSVSEHNDVYANCIKLLARINGDFSICKNIKVQYEFEDCILNFAHKKGDARACFDIENTESINEVNLMHNKDVFSTCIYGVILKNPINKGCEILSNTYYDNYFLSDSCYLKLSISSKSVSWCDKVNSNNLKQDCLNQFEINNAEDCNEISNIDNRDVCFRDKALNSGEAKYCGFISRDFADEQNNIYVDKKSCYSSILFDKQNIEVCHGIINKEVKESCYANVNGYLKSGEDCFKIPDEFKITKAWCFATAASWYGQLQYCDEIDSSIMDGYSNIKEACLN